MENLRPEVKIFAVLLRPIQHLTQDYFPYVNYVGLKGYKILL